MNAVRTVLGKELKDGLRDKRSVLSAFMFPFLGPLLIYFMFNAIIDMRKDLDEIKLPIIGKQHAPALIQWLEQKNVVFETIDEDPIQAVIQKVHSLVLVIPEDFEDRFSVSRSAVIELVSDSSRTDSRAEVGHVRGLLNQYGREIAALRLISRGISPEVVRPVIVQNIEAASKQQISARILNIIPMWIVMAAFICSMGIAVDSTAGERERATLEALLINPVSRTAVVVGKWIAASLFSVVGVILTMAVCFVVLQRLPLEELGLSFMLGTREIIGMLAAVLPLGLMAAGLQLLLGAFAKSFKDAQSYIGILILIPVVPGLMTTFSPIETKTWMTLIPAFGQHMLLTDVIGGKTPAISSFVLSGISALTVALISIQQTAKLFTKEKIIFTR